MAKQEVAKSEANKAMTYSDRAPQQGSQVLSGDLLIPKVLLMQGLSEFVNERKAAQGDIVRSTTGEILGGPSKPVEFIPISYQNVWVMQEKVGQKFEFRGIEPMTASNQNLPWEFKDKGADWKRVKCINLFALLPSDIEKEKAAVEKTVKTGEMPDASVALMPVMISFRSTSYNAGKKVATHFANVESLKARYPKHYSTLKPYCSTLQLGCYADKNDLGQFYVFEVGNGGKTAEEYQKQAAAWEATLGEGSYRVDNSDLSGEGVTAPVGEEDVNY